MFRFYRILVFCLLLSPFAQAQEKLTDLKVNTVLIQHSTELRTRLHTTRLDTIHFSCPYNIIGMPFEEKFHYSGPYPDSSKWIDNHAYVNSTYPIAPMDWGVATLDGINSNGYPYDFTAPATVSVPCDTLTSKRINMNNIGTPGNADSVYFSFFYQAQGRGNQPEPADSLLLEFRSYNDSTWKEVWSHPGYAMSGNDTIFHYKLFSMDTLDGGKYVNNPWFQFRFRNYATPSGNLDHWHVDCIDLRQNRSYTDTLIHGVAFSYPPLSFLGHNLQAMPWRQYAGASDIAPSINTFIRNNESNILPVTYQYQGYHYGSPVSVSYTGNDPVGFNPFPMQGYETYAPVAHPPVGTNGFSFGTSLSDTTVFEIMHNLQPYGDTIRCRQNFYNYYAYDDGSAELGYGIAGVGTGAGAQLAVQYTLNHSDTLRGVQFFWNPILTDVSADGFRLCVWAPGANGPGLMIYRSDSLFTPHYMPGYNHFRTYYLDHQLILSGTFYVGWMQYTEDNMSVGFDQNTNASSQNYYRTDSMANWYGSLYPGSLMIRPLFGDTIRMTGIREQVGTPNNLNIYPNPAKDELVIAVPASEEGHHFLIDIFDAFGKLVLHTQLVNTETIDISSLSPGFYMVRSST
ncbi:MAG TPA: T9SS type A sorting domain-containing protein, partial [Bacteroidia bacterium]|nr:T9SS type A sorting domain-containing protein [Bacteroidia bacterium]